MSEVLHVEKRTVRGTANNRRLRRSGRLPAVLYGHGQESMSLSLSADEVEKSIRHGARVVDLEGDVTTQALLQEVQWDTFFHNVLHLDLLRVEAGDTVTIEILVELRGEAPGANAGGIIEHLAHTVEITVSPSAVPEKLHVNINHLELDQSITASQIEDLPEGAVLTDPEAVVVHCRLPVAVEELEAELGGPAEPEVIGLKAEEEEEGD